MAENTQITVDVESSKKTIDTTIRIGLIILLVYWCILIFEPFLTPVLWAIIIAVAIHPLYLKFESLLGGNQKIALTLFTLIALAVLITPTVMLAGSLMDAVETITTGLEDGTLQVPPAPERVAEWPLIGEKLYGIWSDASNNLTATIHQYGEHIKTGLKWLLSAAAGAGISVLQFILSILIAAAFIANAEGARRFSRSLATRLVGKDGERFAKLSGATVRSVAQGVLGVAAIQGILAGVGMLAVGVPGAGLWSLLVLLLAIMQLPALLVMGPVIVYVFSVTDTLPATLFMIWGIFVSISDTFLKPMLLGRGLDIPMLVILIGALGGMIMSGIIGLFIGAVIFALGYQLFVAWLNQDIPAGEENE
jgi:predicted PurR-regulated permease PerM